MCLTGPGFGVGYDDINFSLCFVTLAPSPGYQLEVVPSLTRHELDVCNPSVSVTIFELKYKESSHSKSAEGMADLFAENAARYGIRMVKRGVRTSTAVNRWRGMTD